MDTSLSQIANMREAVEKLLDELNLEAYLYDIEPGEKQWELTIECAIKDGWETIKLRANKDYFIHGSDDTIIHDLLISEWRETLSACLAKKPQPE